MDKELEKNILAMHEAEQNLFKTCPKMSDPDWWDAGYAGEEKLEGHDLQLAKELAAKAGIEMNED